MGLVFLILDPFFYYLVDEIEIYMIFILYNNG